MGTASSQVAQSQTATQDAPVTSQPATHLPAIDASQDDEPRESRRVAERMDTSVEDTVRKAKRARMKASPRAQKRSQPQHTRGYAIQPSQDIPSTQSEAQAGAEDAEEDAVDVAEGDHAMQDDGASPVAGPTERLAEKPRQTRGKKKRLHWQDDAVEPTVDQVDAAQNVLDNIDVNTVNSTSAPSAKKKRKRSDVELEKLQKDAQDFAPELESTPKPKAPSKKKQRQSDDDENLTAIDEQAETSDHVEQPATKARSLKGGGKGGNTKSMSRSQAKPNSKPSLTEARRRNRTSDDEEPEHDREVIASVSGNDDPPAEPIPTPPESPENPTTDNAQYEENEQTANGDDPDDDDSQSTADEQDEADHKIPSPIKTQSRVNGAKKRKRTDKASAKGGGNPSGEEDDFDESVDEENAKPSRDVIPKSKNMAKRERASSDDEASGKDQRGRVKGTWSKEERARADAIFEDVVRVTAIPAYELKTNIIDWKNATPALEQFKTELFEAFPQRDFRSIRKFAQRRYNAYDRGKWTEEQDQRLHEAFELWPDQWTAISDHVGRFWEDCRGRWRDVLSQPATKAVGPWSREEELQLAKVVRESLDTVIMEIDGDEAPEDPEQFDALISWKAVAEKMGNVRNAKRCREKWKRIKHQDLSVDAAWVATQPITSKKPSWRTREADAEFENCENGDVYDILAEIYDAVPDLDRVFDHETTFWSVVAVKNPDSKFTSALRRKALAFAVEQFSCKAVRAAKTWAAKADAAKRRMDVLEAKGEIELVRSYEKKPKEKKVKASGTKTVDGKSAGEKAAKKKKRSSDGGANDAKDGAHVDEEAAQPSKKATAARSRKTGTSKVKDSSKYKSADLVVDSDEGEQDAANDDDDIQVAQTPAEQAGDSDGSVDEDEDADDDDNDRKVRQATDERSLPRRRPDLSPSDFLERCKDGQGKAGTGRAEGKGKKGKAAAKK